MSFLFSLPLIPAGHDLPHPQGPQVDGRRAGRGDSVPRQGHPGGSAVLQQRPQLQLLLRQADRSRSDGTIDNTSETRKLVKQKAILIVKALMKKKKMFNVRHQAAQIIGHSFV